MVIAILYLRKGAHVCLLFFVSVEDVAKDLEDHEEQLKTFDKGTGRIEINHDGQLERVFFRVPEICAHLTERTKQALLWSVDR